ncbi:hypothetical protein WICPIJ_009215 [Wickerhamomyces pijperi]|uniref:DNA sliding clamp PCNA n=1 Tax=Wickerhamomyces pijperi TaxID=599730 RepID=A0A9P8PQZ3_WICPI|nr:hypothetical protein WICPIJ_009215 [Wickerhamomyces pijperi]
MFEAKFEQAALFKKIIDAIKDTTSLCNFNCTEHGITVQAVDDSRVLLISLLIGSDCFQSYRCDKSITLGMDMSNLSKVLKTGNANDSLTLMAEDSPDSLLIVFEESEKSKISEYTLKLMDIESDYFNIDDIEQDSLITLPASEFQKTVKDLSQISDSLAILVTKDTIKFHVKGEMGDGDVILKPAVDLENTDNSVKIELNKAVNLNFGIKYILDIIKGSSLAPAITIKLTDQNPALFEFKLSSGYLRFYLAPKFEEDEE